MSAQQATGAHREYATGPRNPNGLQFEPRTHALCAVVDERDELGPDLVPGYLTSVKDGAFYGSPYSYYGQHVDPRVRPQRPDLVAKAIPPDYALSAHVAPLGLVFDTGSSLPAHYLGGAFVGEHGSWARSVLDGYKVVFVPFTSGRPSGMAEDVVTGFLADGRGRGGRWRSPWTPRAPCASPTTPATRSGASKRRPNRVRINGRSARVSKDVLM